MDITKMRRERALKGGSTPWRKHADALAAKADTLAEAKLADEIDALVESNVLIGISKVIQLMAKADGKSAHAMLDSVLGAIHSLQAERADSPN